MLGFDRVASVVVAGVWVVEARGSDIKVGLAIADGVLVRAEVGCLENNSGGVAFARNIGSSCDFEASSAFCEVPVISPQGGRYGSCPVVFCSVLVAAWGGPEGIGVTVDLFAFLSESTTTGAARAIPVAGCAGPRGTGSLGGNSTEDGTSEVFHSL